MGGQVPCQMGMWLGRWVPCRMGMRLSGRVPCLMGMWLGREVSCRMEMLLPHWGLLHSLHLPKALTRKDRSDAQLYIIYIYIHSCMCA